MTAVWEFKAKEFDAAHFLLKAVLTMSRIGCRRSEQTLRRFVARRSACRNLLDLSVHRIGRAPSAIPIRFLSH
jgi:hypothetical protein